MTTDGAVGFVRGDCCVCVCVCAGEGREQPVGNVCDDGGGGDDSVGVM